MHLATVFFEWDKAFGGGYETWVRLQAAYDVAQTEKTAEAIKVKRDVQKSDWVFAGFLCTSIACTVFSRSTAAFKVKDS